jgi:hypothetical protein
MEKLRVLCRSCNTELQDSGRTVTCGCSNMTTIIGGTITANNMANVVMLNTPNVKEKSGVLKPEDIAWQEARRQRKVRKLDFEIR